VWKKQQELYHVMKPPRSWPKESKGFINIKENERRDKVYENYTP